MSRQNGYYERWIAVFCCGKPPPPDFWYSTLNMKMFYFVINLAASGEVSCSSQKIVQINLVNSQIMAMEAFPVVCPKHLAFKGLLVAYCVCENTNHHLTIGGIYFTRGH